MKTPYSFTPFQRRSSHSALFVLFSFFFAAVVVLAMAGGIVKAHPGATPGAGGDPPPVVVDSIEPAEIVQGQVPQPTLEIFGSNFIEGLPNKNNRPTVTLRQPGKGGAEFSALAWVNFPGTVATVPPEMMNLLQAPLGVYDVIVTRPTDGASGTLEGAFTVTDGQPDPGEIALMVRSIWGGPVNDVDIVGDLAYVANGRALRILDVADPANIVELGSLYIPSGVSGVAVSGNYAFLAASQPYRFTVVDVSDPTNPVLVSAGIGGSDQDVLLYGNLAYVLPNTVGSSGGPLRVFDITDPQSVVHLGVVSSVGSSAGAITIVGDLLYVGTERLTVGEPSIDFVAFRVYDLAADPLDPPLLGEVQFNVSNIYGGGSTYGVAVEGDYAVWTLRKEADGVDPAMLLVVDISDPTAPVIVGTHNDGLDSVLTDVVLAGGLAYVADAAFEPRFWAEAKGLVVFDIATDPSNPTIISTFKTRGSVTGLEVVGNRAYLRDAGEGLIILDISNPADPVRLGNYYSPAVLRQMVKESDLLYVADAWNGFTVLDVSDASHPDVVGVYLAEHYNDLGVDAWGIDFGENVVYLGAGHLGLEVVDVSDPANPTFLAAYRITPPFVARSQFAGLAVSGDVAHVGFAWAIFGSCGASLLNLDLSNLPNSITQLGEVQIGRCAPPLTIELNDQSIAFLARDYGIGSDIYTDLTIDTFDPANPTVIYDGVVPAVADVALDVDRKILYLAGLENTGEPIYPGLYIQDVTDPANPVLLAYIDENYPLAEGVELDYAFAVAIREDRLYVAGRGCVPGCGRKAIYCFDVSSPSAPVLLATKPFIGAENGDLHVDQSGVYVTNGGGPQSGLVLLELVGLNPVGDLDGDGTVGVADLLILLANWGPCPPKGECTADLNGDGSVGVADLLILLANWG